MNLGVWTPFRASGPLGPPEELPLGRAALALTDEGIDLVVGHPAGPGIFDGVRARRGRWESLTGLPVQAVYDRFPSASRPQAFAAGLARIRGLPLVNDPVLTALCRDKLACQQALGDLPQPDVTTTDLPGHLSRWGVAFLKPREGSFGRGVRQVRAGDALPDGPGWILQRAVLPPEGFGAGLALRVLVQRDGTTWHARPAVARISDHDPVVNAARGARLAPAADLLPAHTDAAVRDLAVRTAERLASHGLFVECGVDIVLDSDLSPFVIEVNSRPRGRLRGLAELHPDRFRDLHVQACITPFRTLARLVGH